MRRHSDRKLGVLLVLNAALLALLAAVVLSPAASAQSGPARARGTYTMVGGKVIGSPEDAIYIVDAANQEMVAAKWDRSRKALKFLGYYDLAPARRAVPSTDPGR